MLNLKFRYLIFGIAVALTLYFVSIPVKLAIVKSHTPSPQAIFVLGGGQERIEFAAELAHQHSQLDVWISSGGTAEQAANIFGNAKVSLSRVKLDNRATDTVTNFTTLVDTFQRERLAHVYLITSDFHMRRARMLAFLVLGSKGIAYEPVSVPTDERAESNWRILRDVLRALFWLATGKTGALPKI